jgi:hypothetical protein
VVSPDDLGIAMVIVLFVGGEIRLPEEAAAQVISGVLLPTPAVVDSG